MELLVGEGYGPLKSLCVCPHEGSCLQKVMTRCRSGHGLIRKFVVSPVEIETSRTPLGMLYGSGTAVVIRRSAEPQMQRTSMFFLSKSSCDCLRRDEPPGAASGRHLGKEYPVADLKVRGGRHATGRESARCRSGIAASVDYPTMARMRTGASPGVLFFAGATMMSEPVAGSEVKRAVPSTT